MKSLYAFVFLIVLLAGAHSCANNDNGDVIEAMPGQVTAVIGGDAFRSDIGATSGSFSILLNTKTIEVDATSSTNANEVLIIGMVEDEGGAGDCLSTGVYGQDALSQRFATMAYIVGGTTYTTLGQDVELSVTITDCNPAEQTISGEFSARLQVDIDGATIELQNGRFNQIPFTK